MESWVGIGVLEGYRTRAVTDITRSATKGDAMEIFVIAPYASGYPRRLATIIYRSVANSLHLWLADSAFFLPA